MSPQTVKDSSTLPFDRLYSIHGEWFRLMTESPAVVQAADDLLAGFAGASTETTSRPLTVALRSVRSLVEIPEAIPLSAVNVSSNDGPGEGYTLYRSDNRWFIDFRAYGLVCVDIKGKRIDGWLVQPEAMHPDLPAAFVRLSVIELLRLRGLYTLHAAALEKNGCGIVIAGPCGRGKTTCALALVRAGFRCLSDDHPLLRRSRTGLELLPFLSGVDVTQRTIDFFPELTAVQHGFRPRLEKRSFRLADVYAPKSPSVTRPNFLIFPRLADWPESILEPLPRARALEELLPESLLVMDHEMARNQFQALAELVRTTACYRLHFGEDVLNVPAIFDRLLERVPVAA